MLETSDLKEWCRMDLKGRPSGTVGVQTKLVGSFEVEKEQPTSFSKAAEK